MPPLRPSASLAVIAAALLGWAGPARADTLCVGVADTAGCTAQYTSGSLGARLGQAIDAAESTPADDIIRLGPGTYDQGATFAYNPTVSGTTTADLTIQGDAPGVVIANTGTTKDDETVEGQLDTAPLHLRDLTIEGPAQAEASLGLEISAQGSTLDRVTLKAPATAAKPSALFAAIDVRKNAVTIRNSVIQGFHKALFTACRTVGGKNFGGKALLQRVTVDATGPMSSGIAALDEKSVGGIDASCNHEANRGAQTGAPSVTVENSILTDAVTVREADGGAMTLTRSRWKGTSAQEPGTSVAATSMTTAAPGFLSGADLRLTAGSAMIDAAGAAVAGERDRAGDARSVDGDGNGSAVPDLGAYEFQPAAPPTPTPGSGGGVPTPTPNPGGATPTPTATPGPDPGGATATPGPTPSGPTPPPSAGSASPTPLPGESGTPGGGGGGGVTVPQVEALPTLRIGKGTLRVNARGRLTLRLSCLPAAPCRGTVRLLGIAPKRGKAPILASADVHLAAGSSANVTLLIRAASRANLRRKGGTLSLAYTPTGATRAAATLRVKIARA